MPHSPRSKLFITGASGQLGRLVIEHLLDQGQAHLTAGSRNPDAVADLAARGVVLRQADFDDPSSLERAFAGIERILIISAPDTPDDPSRRLRQHLAAVETAAKSGVRRIIYTSMLNPEPGSPIAFAPDHHRTEQAIQASGVPYTILRPSWYADSVSLWLPQVLASGQWLSAAGNGRTAHVWRDDLARAAAAALLTATDDSSVLPVTGPQALTPAQIASTVNEVFDTSIDLVPLNDADLRECLSFSGLPSGLVDLLVALDANTRQGGVDVVSDTVERLTGRPPRSLRDYLVEHREALLAARDAMKS